MNKLKCCENGRISAITLITQHPSLWPKSGAKKHKGQEGEIHKNGRKRKKAEDCEECWNLLMHKSSL